MPYEITQCYLPPGRGDFPPLPQPKLVLDLATPEGCKAELTWVSIIAVNVIIGVDRSTRQCLRCVHRKFSMCDNSSSNSFLDLHTLYKRKVQYKMTVMS